MRYLVTFVYWIVAVLMLSLILVSFDYGFGRAFFLATSLLPGMLCAKFFLPEALRAPHHKVVIVLCVILGILFIEWQALLLMNMYVALHPFSKLPDLFSNPIFILVLLAAFVLPEEMLSHYLQQRMSTREEEISFISNRRKVTLSLTDILFVESNDNEVILHAVAACYRTKTRISQWEQLLDDRFVRIHRAYIVNSEHVTAVAGNELLIDGNKFEFSRKYKSRALNRFAEIELKRMQLEKPDKG